MGQVLESVMRGFGMYLVANRLQAVLGIGLLSLVAVFMMPLAYLLSGTPLGLVSLRCGPLISLQVILGCLFVLLVLLLAAGIAPTIAIGFGFALGIWLPIWFCATVLRNTESQGSMVLAAGFFGLAYIIIIHALFSDVQAMWKEKLFSWLRESMTETNLEQVAPSLEQVIPYMNVMMANGIITSIVLAVMLARWWQSWIYYPGGFRKEFCNLRFPKELLIATFLGVLVVMSGVAEPFTAIREVLIVMLFLYVFQGVSIVHGIIIVKKLSRWWLFGMYLMLVFFPLQACFLMSCIGVSGGLFRLSGVQDSSSGGSR